MLIVLIEDIQAQLFAMDLFNHIKIVLPPRIFQQTENFICIFREALFFGVQDHLFRQLFFQLTFPHEIAILGIIGFKAFFHDLPVRVL
jgi:hypothetical protein